MYRGIVRLPFVVCLLVLLNSAPRTEAEATANAGSAAGQARNQTATDFASWRWVFNPSPTDVIAWSSGVNHADGVAFGPFPFGPESKFNVIPPPITGRNFDGFLPPGDVPLVNTGPLGSTAVTSGDGRSVRTAGFGGPNYFAAWHVNATGAKVSQGSWDSTASAFDPYSYELADFQGALTEPFMDLYFVVALEAGNYSLAGRITLRAAYQVAAGTTTVLIISIDDSDVQVTTNVPPGSRFYRLDSLDQGPIEDATRLMTGAAIRSFILSDVELDRTIDTPLYLGILMENLPVPTADLGDGSVARIRVETVVHDGAGGSASPVTNVRMDSTEVFWSPDPAGGVYDVVYGNLGMLRATSGNFTVSMNGCVENNSPDVHADHTGVVPAVGQAFYYLVRSATDFGVTGTYGTPEQDVEIAASGVSCP